MKHSVNSETNCSLIIAHLMNVCCIPKTNQNSWEVCLEYFFFFFFNAIFFQFGSCLFSLKYLFLNLMPHFYEQNRILLSKMHITLTVMRERWERVALDVYIPLFSLSLSWSLSIKAPRFAEWDFLNAKTFRFRLVSGDSV